MPTEIWFSGWGGILVLLCIMLYAVLDVRRL